jgi:hypothetical protein
MGYAEESMESMDFSKKVIGEPWFPGLTLKTVSK